MTKPKSYAAYIKEGSGFELIKEYNPDAGIYEPHKNFGENLKGIDFGRKYDEKYNDNPPPGFYNIDDASALTKPRN